MKIITEAEIHAPIETVWRTYNDPAEIVQWDASGEWHTIRASTKTVSGASSLPYGCALR